MSGEGWTKDVLVLEGLAGNGKTFLFMRIYIKQYTGHIYLL